MLRWPDTKRGGVVRLFRKIKSKRKHFFLLSHGEAFSSSPAFPFPFSRSFHFSLTLHAPASLSPTVAFTRVIMGNLHHPCPFYLLSFSLIATFSSFLSTSCMQSGLRPDRNEMMKKLNEMGLPNKPRAGVTPSACAFHFHPFPNVLNLSKQPTQIQLWLMCLCIMVCMLSLMMDGLMTDGMMGC